MKKTLLAVTLAALTSGAATSALAADPKSPEPDYTLSANVGLFSDYRFRGVSQSGNKPALQGGFDFAHKSGFYAGNWNSSINWIPADQGTSSGLESDFYLGYKFDLAGVGLDVGNLYYYYAGEDMDSTLNTNEVYIGLSYGPISFKTSYTTSAGYFGGAGKGTLYYSLSGAFPVSDTLSLKAAYGKQVGGEAATLDGVDYSVGIAADLGDGWSLGLSYIGTSGDVKDVTNAATPDSVKSAAVVSISRSF
jgi:uncharacterized protein (TIGR02001 family)